MLRNQDLNLLPVFDALIKEQKLSAAAISLGMSQPAVSHALKRLRATYEDQLFVRTGQGLRPTDRALEIHAGIAPALESIRQSYQTSEFAPNTLAREINVVMNGSLELMTSGLMARRLRSRAPNLQVKIHSDLLPDIPARLKDGRLQYAVEYIPIAGNDFSSQLLAQEKLVVIASVDNKHVKGRLTLQQYKDLPHVSLTPRVSPIETQNYRQGTPVEHLLNFEIPDRQIVAWASNYMSLPEIVSQSDLIATVPSRLASEHVRAGSIKYFPLPFDHHGYEYRLYWHKSVDNDLGHRWLVDQWLEIAQEISVKYEMT